MHARSVVGMAIITMMTMIGCKEGPQGPAGAMGAMGVMGERGPVGMSWRGGWMGGTTYQPGDVVQMDGSAYVAVATTTSQPPGTSWSLLAAAGIGLEGPIGATGPKGDTGPVGPTGPAAQQLHLVAPGADLGIYVGDDVGYMPQWKVMVAWSSTQNVSYEAAGCIGKGYLSSAALLPNAYWYIAFTGTLVALASATAVPLTTMSDLTADGMGGTVCLNRQSPGSYYPISDTGIGVTAYARTDLTVELR